VEGLRRDAVDFVVAQGQAEGVVHRRPLLRVLRALNNEEVVIVRIALLLKVQLLTRSLLATLQGLHFRMNNLRRRIF